MLYSGALDVSRYLQAWGPTIILSDGDVVFQSHKVRRPWLWGAVEGWVLIYIHTVLSIEESRSEEFRPKCGSGVLRAQG